MLVYLARERRGLGIGFVCYGRNKEAAGRPGASLFLAQLTVC
jgi:hypothetical protein